MRDLFDATIQTVGDFWKIVPHERGKLCVYFPAEKETTNLRFHVNGPFASTISRDCIPHGEENGRLRDQIVKLLVKSLLRLRDEGLANESFLATLPNASDNLSTFYLPFRSELKKCFEAQDLIATSDGGFRSSAAVYLGGEAYRRLLDKEELLFFSKGQRRYWAKPIFSTRARVFLRTVLGVPEVDDEFFLQEVKSHFDSGMSGSEDASDWLLSRGIAWLRQFYGFLAGRQLPVQHCRIILGSDGRLHRPSQLFLAPKDVPSRDFDLVVLVNDDVASGEVGGRRMVEVLGILGVKEVNSSEVVRALLNHYYVPSSQTFDEGRHLEHMRRFLVYWEGKGRETHLFEDRPLFRDRESRGYRRASEVYLGRPYREGALDTVLHSSLHGSLVWAGYAVLGTIFSQFAEALGVRTRIEFEEIRDVSMNPELQQHVTKNTTAFMRDWILPRSLIPDNDLYLALPAVLAGTNAPTLPPRYEWNVDKARCVWNLMCEAKETLFLAQFRKSNPMMGRSLLVQILREYAWVPDRSGFFRRPRDLRAERLLDGFGVDDTCGWLKEVAFGGDRNADEAGVVEVQSKAEDLIRSRTGFSLQEIEELREAELRFWMFGGSSRRRIGIQRLFHRSALIVLDAGRRRRRRRMSRPFGRSNLFCRKWRGCLRTLGHSGERTWRISIATMRVCRYAKCADCACHRPRFVSVTMTFISGRGNFCQA